MIAGPDPERRFWGTSSRGTVEARPSRVSRPSVGSDAPMGVAPWWLYLALLVVSSLRLDPAGSSSPEMARPAVLSSFCFCFSGFFFDPRLGAGVERITPTEAAPQRKRRHTPIPLRILLISFRIVSLPVSSFSSPIGAICWAAFCGSSCAGLPPFVPACFLFW